MNVEEGFRTNRALCGGTKEFPIWPKSFRHRHPSLWLTTGNTLMSKNLQPISRTKGPSQNRHCRISRSNEITKSSQSTTFFMKKSEYFRILWKAYFKPCRKLIHLYLLIITKSVKLKILFDLFRLNYRNMIQSLL